MSKSLVCLIAGETFGQRMRRARSLERSREFESCLNEVNLVIQNLEEECPSLKPKLLLSQMELLSVAYNFRGQVRYLQVDFCDAVQDFTHAVEINPRMAAAFCNRALIHYRMGRFEEAKKDLEKALSLNKFYEEARKNLEVVKKELEKGSQENQHTTSQSEDSLQKSTTQSGASQTAQNDT